MEPAQLFLSLVSVFAFVAGAFLVSRAVVCWYLRLNEILTVLEEIRDALQIPRTSLPPSPVRGTLKQSRSSRTPA